MSRGEVGTSELSPYPRIWKLDEIVKLIIRRFQQLYREYHLENKAINSQPPTSAKYLLRLYPMTVERDALLESAEVEYQYK